MPLSEVAPGRDAVRVGGVKVAVPSAVVVSQKPVPVAKDVVWKTAVCAIASSMPGSPVHGFVIG
jgi:hypothetical protein